jgi:hypothetical protein
MVDHYNVPGQFAAPIFKVDVLISLSLFYPVDGGRRFLRKVTDDLPDHTALYNSRQ